MKNDKSHKTHNSSTSCHLIDYLFQHSSSSQQPPASSSSQQPAAASQQPAGAARPRSHSAAPKVLNKGAVFFSHL
jgi:hypothetical protein